TRSPPGSTGRLPSRGDAHPERRQSLERSRTAPPCGRPQPGTLTGLAGFSGDSGIVVLVAPAHPAGAAPIAFITSLRNEIEIVVGDVQHVQPASVGRVGVEDLPR